jgi:hypothetical protein
MKTNKGTKWILSHLLNSTTRKMNFYVNFSPYYFNFYFKQQPKILFCKINHSSNIQILYDILQIRDNNM